MFLGLGGGKDLSASNTAAESSAGTAGNNSTEETLVERRLDKVTITNLGYPFLYQYFIDLTIIKTFFSNLYSVT